MTTLRPDLAIIARNVRNGSRILDVGCGDGALMAALRDHKNADARGLEIDPVNVATAVARGDATTTAEHRVVERAPCGDGRKPAPRRECRPRAHRKAR